MMRWILKRNAEQEAGLKQESNDTPIRLQIRLKFAFLAERLPRIPEIDPRAKKAVVVAGIIILLYPLRNVATYFLLLPLPAQILALGVLAWYVGYFYWAKKHNIGPIFDKHIWADKEAPAFNPWTGEPREKTDNEKFKGEIEP